MIHRKGVIIKMNKFIGYLIPVILLLIFIFIMNSSDFIKDKNIHDNINILNNYLIDEEWNEARIHFHKLKNRWDKNVKLLQFSVERNEIRNINSGIARLQGSLIAQDRASALIELNNIKAVWSQLGS